jgi:hypothetical protein
MTNKSVDKKSNEKQGYDLDELKSLKYISNIGKNFERRNENESKPEGQSNGEVCKRS